MEEITINRKNRYNKQYYLDNKDKAKEYYTIHKDKYKN